MPAVYDLNAENIMLLAIKHYEKPCAIMSEFETDFKRVKYIKRLIGKYKTGEGLKYRLVLNHIIILSNVFGVEFTSRLLFFKLDNTHYSVLKTFLLYLEMMPESINTIDGLSLISSDIQVDLKVADCLRNL
jgi:hypothetical protein